MLSPPPEEASHGRCAGSARDRHTVGTACTWAAQARTCWVWSVSIHFCSKTFWFTKGMRITCPQLPQYLTHILLNRNRFFWPRLFINTILIIFFTYIDVYICIYIHTYHIQVWFTLSAFKKSLKETQLFVSLGENITFSTILIYPLKQNSLFLSDQPASHPAPKGQSLRNLFVVSNRWASLTTSFSSGAICPVLKYAGLGSGKLKPHINSGAL